jgi:hypothetical protein
MRVDTDGQLCGVVESRTFRRDHFLLRVGLSSGVNADVAVAPDALPDLGATVHLTVDPDGLVVLPLPLPHPNGHAPS